MEKYRELLEHVEANIGLLEEQLADSEVWRMPVKRLDELSPLPPAPAPPAPASIVHEEEAKGDSNPTFYARFCDCFGLRSCFSSWYYDSPTIRKVFWDIETWFLNYRVHYEEMDERREREMRQLEEGDVIEW
jgi:hypothetical protein